MRVYPTTAPQDAATSTLLHHLRYDVIPQATEGTGAKVYVGGFAALTDDFANLLSERLPLFIGVVIGLSFLLLMVVFRSILVPLKAAIMNLLSIGAAYGVIVAVFQWGWGKDLIGLGKEGPIEAFLPMMMFAILFGLSMDYEVFLLSRIREEYLRSGDNAQAVADGLASTARVDHRRGRHHVHVLPVVRARRQRRHQALRHRVLGRDLHRRHAHPHGARARRRWSCSATPTGGCRAGSTASCPTSTSRVRRPSSTRSSIPTGARRA